uniref:Uncharacterized protein n=1 Tax=Arcella intermedia TaxID=1963864 RepID=A0A6B2LT08_9EUKA
MEERDKNSPLTSSTSPSTITAPTKPTESTSTSPSRRQNSSSQSSCSFQQALMRTRTTPHSLLGWLMKILGI